MTKPSYQEMRQIALDRAEKAGFAIGTRIEFRKRTGVVAGINPFFYDVEPLKILVHLDPYKQYKAKWHELISLAELTPSL